MSYEGITQIICQNGHYHEYTSSQEHTEPGKSGSCPECGSSPQFRHEVDLTNGEVTGDSSTLRAWVNEIYIGDIPFQDHLGNVYFAKDLRYEPHNPKVWTHCQGSGHPKRTLNLAEVNGLTRSLNWKILLHGIRYSNPSDKF